MYFVCPKRDVQYKQNEFHFRHLGMDLNRAWPVTSDVSHCVRVTSILIMVVLSKYRKLETSLKSIKDVLQNNNCTERTSDERRRLIPVGHISCHRLSSVPVLSKMAEIKLILLQLNVSFRTNKIDKK